MAINLEENNLINCASSVRLKEIMDDVFLFLVWFFHSHHIFDIYS